MILFHSITTLYTTQTTLYQNFEEKRDHGRNMKITRSTNAHEKNMIDEL